MLHSLFLSVVRLQLQSWLQFWAYQYKKDMDMLADMDMLDMDMLE